MKVRKMQIRIPPIQDTEIAKTISKSTNKSSITPIKIVNRNKKKNCKVTAANKTISNCILIDKHLFKL